MSNEVKSVGVVGGGVTGHATARVFMEHADVKVYDVVTERGPDPLAAVLECDVVFVCLPTPQGKGRLAADLTALTGFFAPLAGSAAHLVLRSTVPVGTTRRLAREYKLRNLVHSPEFLTARCAVADAHLPAQLVVGSPREPSAGHRVEGLYLRRFPGTPLRLMASDASELAKLTLNSFFATKLSFFNEVRAYADAAGVAWGDVMDVVLGDGRVAHSHTKVPGHDGKRGWGGACLPKDVADLIECIESAAGCSAPVTRAALARNETDRGRPL